MARAAPPDFVEPQLATLVKQAPEGDAWLHELKYDGYRILARLDRGQVRLWSRRRNDWTAQLPTIRDAIAALPATTALLDGEAAVVLPDGKTSFQHLQNAFGGGGGGARPGGPVRYFAFDLVFLDGEDLRRLTLDERKARLEALLARARGDVVCFSKHVIGHGGEVFAGACASGLEGIISKKRDQPYRSGRNDCWRKIKCMQRQELVVGGFTDEKGNRVGLGALLVGYHQDGALIYAGKVGTGFTQRTAAELRRELEARAQKDSPFAPAPSRALVGGPAHWVRPELVAEIEFGEWTADGRLRHPSFKGLRRDKSAAEVVRERPSPAGATTSRAAPTTTPTATPAPSVDEIAGVRLSNPGRVLYPERGLTKRDVARYLEAVSPWMLPQVVGRPLTLLHCPTGLAGDCRFLRHAKTWGPAALRRVRIQEKTKLGEYLVVDDLAGLIALAQMDVLEIHTWNTTTEHLELPDRLVLDLDPGPEVPWTDVVSAARHVRTALQAIGLDSLVKTTGGSGLHVVAPIAPRLDVAACLAFARAFSEALAADEPRRFTTAYGRAGRDRLILLDYLRNNRTNTSVAAYSPRATAAAPVSMPLSWDELSPRRRSDAFTIESAARHLARRGADPWASYAELAARQRLPLAATAAQALSATPAPRRRAARASRPARPSPRGRTRR